MSVPIQTLMDIRHVLGQIIPINVKPLEKVEKTLKSDQTNDRDADGRSGQDSREERRPMTDEEFAAHVQHLRELDAIKSNGLQVQIESVAGLRYVILLAANGERVRRVSELDLWSLNIDKDVKKGKLLSRSA